jgi:hypothetical protein
VPISTRRAAAGGEKSSIQVKLPLSAHALEVKADATAADATKIASAGLPGLQRCGNAILAREVAESLPIYPLCSLIYSVAL